MKSQDIIVISIEDKDLSLREIAKEIESIDGVRAAGTTSAMSGGASNIELWVQLATALTSLTTASIILITAIVARLREKKVSGTFTFPNGKKLRLEEASEAAVKKIFDLD